MSQIILSQMLQKLQLLEPEELQQLNCAVQDHLVNREVILKQTDFHKALESSGLVRQIKKTSFRAEIRQLIQVQGAPISQTIIEERR